MQPDEPPAKPALVAEGDDWIVVDKPAGLLVHPTRPNGPRTLWHWLREVFVYEETVGGRIAIVNRLDRETSGLTLVASSLSGARRLGIAMQRHEIRKSYLAIVLGHPDWETADADSPLLRAGEVGESAVWLKQRSHPQGSASRTRFRVLERAKHPRAGAVTLLEAFPETGRLHQIRVHAADLGFPLVGDKLYADGDHIYLRFIETGWTPELAARVFLPRHALHANRLIFDNGAGRDVCVESPLPEDLAAFWRETGREIPQKSSGHPVDGNVLSRA